MNGSVPLEVDDLCRLIPIAMEAPKVTHSQRWRYYCGVVWNTIRSLQSAAADHLDDDRDPEDAWYAIGAPTAEEFYGPGSDLL